MDIDIDIDIDSMYICTDCIMLKSKVKFRPDWGNNLFKGPTHFTVHQCSMNLWTEKKGKSCPSESDVVIG